MVKLQHVCPDSRHVRLQHRAQTAWGAQRLRFSISLLASNSALTENTPKVSIINRLTICSHTIHAVKNDLKGRVNSLYRLDLPVGSPEVCLMAERESGRCTQPIRGAVGGVMTFD